MHRPIFMQRRAALPPCTPAERGPAAPRLLCEHKGRAGDVSVELHPQRGARGTARHRDRGGVVAVGLQGWVGRRPFSWLARPASVAAALNHSHSHTGLRNTGGALPSAPTPAHGDLALSCLLKAARHRHAHPAQPLPAAAPASRSPCTITCMRSKMSSVPKQMDSSRARNTWPLQQPMRTGGHA